MPEDITLLPSLPSLAINGHHLPSTAIICHQFTIFMPTSSSLSTPMYLTAAAAKRGLDWLARVRVLVVFYGFIFRVFMLLLLFFETTLKPL